MALDGHCLEARMMQTLHTGLHAKPIGLLTVYMGIIIVCLMICTPSVYAESAFKQGFKRGISDFNHGFPWSVLTPTGNIFDKYPGAFADGWLAGMCSKGYGGSDEDRLTFDCGHNVPYAMFKTQNAPYIAGFDDGVIDRRNGVFVQEKITGFRSDFANGYATGWKSMCHQTRPNTYCGG
jgi:hypothetical protein